jgi:hypothetical protein
MGGWGRKLSEVDEAPKGPLVGTPSTLHYHMKLFINNALDLHFFFKIIIIIIFILFFFSISNMKHNCGVHHQIPTTPTPMAPTLMLLQLESPT